ncbi:MAG: outer membrane protein assembly factor BamD (BamD/ComL family), partial [Saprospiraceae bacterium]
MCKTLLFRYLLLSFALLGVSSVIAQEFAKSRPDRTIDFHQQVQERLFSTALSQMDISELSSLHLQIKKDQVISLLNTRYPELVYELENTPEQIISEKEISKLLLTIIKEESSFGNLDLEGSLWESAQSSIADSEGIATLEFLFGYELFKQKRLKEAQKNFQRLAKMRKGPYEYALYYGGLSSLLNKEFPEAINQLKAIGKEEALKPHISYYLSAAHYGNGDFTSVIKYFENRIQDQKLFNIEGITQIVAYSNYHLNRYEAAINNFNILSQYRNLSEDEKYILGKALLKTGQNIEGNSLLSEIAVQSQESKLKQSASYEYALNLSKEGKYEEAKSMFISMLSDDQYQKEDLQYNITILHAKTGNYNNATKNALALIKGKYQKEVLSLLSDMIDHIENPSTYIAVVEAIDLRAQDKSVIKSSLYKKAIIALQAGNFSTANSYFEKLKTIDPLIEERGAVAAWKGIMAYKDGDFKSAQKLLANYLNSKPTQETTISINRELEFYAHYFLAYSSFKLKDHKNALGHFSKSLAIVTNPSDKNMIEDIQLRIGDSYFLMVQYDQAKKSYDVAESLDQSYRPYALWQKAVIAELQNELYDQLLILDDIIGTHPESKYFGRAAFSAANTLFALGKYDKSATLYKRLESEDVPNRMKEEAIVQLGLISVN